MLQSPSPSNVSRDGSPISREHTHSLGTPALHVNTAARPDGLVSAYPPNAPAPSSTVRRAAEEQLDILINLVLSDDADDAMVPDAQHRVRENDEGLRNADGQLDLGKIKAFFESRTHTGPRGHNHRDVPTLGLQPSLVHDESPEDDDLLPNFRPITPQLLGVLPPVAPELVSPLALDDSPSVSPRAQPTGPSYLLEDVFSSQRATLGASTVPELSYGSTATTTEPTTLQTQSLDGSASTSLTADPIPPINSRNDGDNLADTLTQALTIANEELSSLRSQVQGLRTALGHVGPLPSDNSLTQDLTTRGPELPGTLDAQERHAPELGSSADVDGNVSRNVFRFVRNIDALVWRRNRSEEEIFSETNVTALMDRLELWEPAVRTKSRRS